MVTTSAWDNLSSHFADLAERTSKSIVAIHGGKPVAASAVVWRADLIVTASHMLRRTEELEVTLADKRRSKATFLGRDSGTDLAVLRLENASPVSPIEIGDTAQLRVGQLVLAIGRSTLGDLAASAGILARLGDAWQTWRGGRMDSLLRPDITLYPGQSGSALIDSNGRALGINTNALARGSVITVPVKTVERVVNEILEHGGVFRPYLGVAMQPVSLPANLADKFKLGADTALMIMQVEDGSPSAKSGMTLGDLIVSLNGQPIGGMERIQRTLSGAKRGDSVDVGYIRGGEMATAKIKMADRPQR